MEQKKTIVLTYKHFKVCLFYLLLAKKYFFGGIRDYKGTGVIIQAEYSGPKVRI